MGQMEMKCIFNIGKKNSKWAKVTQMSDVAHGPLVSLVISTTSMSRTVSEYKND
jgi:hypothetical protein